VRDRLDRALDRNNILNRVRKLERRQAARDRAGMSLLDMPPLPRDLSYSLDLEYQEASIWAMGEFGWESAEVREWVVGYQKSGDSESHSYGVSDNSFALH